MTEILPPGSAAPARVTGGRGGRGGAQGAANATDEKRGTDSQEFLKKQEKELLEAVRERAKAREEEEAKHKKEHPRKPFELQARQRVTRLELCPDGKCVIAMIGEAGDRSKPDNVPSYVNESAYTEEISGRNNVGDAQTKVRAAVVDSATGEVKWVDGGIKDRDVQF